MNFKITSTSTRRALLRQMLMACVYSQFKLASTRNGGIARRRQQGIVWFYLLLLLTSALVDARCMAQDCLSLPNVPVIYVDASYTGPNPNGSANAPFPRVTDAYNAAADCNIINLTAGNYSEAIRLSKHIKLQAQGGPVAIGGLSGTYYGDDNAVYYIQRSGNDLWWVGESVDAGKTPLQVWHRGLDYSTVFHGTMVGNTATGEWVDVCRGASLATGSATVRIDTTVSASGTTSNHLVLIGGSFHATQFAQGKPVNDFQYEYPDHHLGSADFYERFKAVHKNDIPMWDGNNLYPFSAYAETQLGDTFSPQNLRPYRDQTVFYGELTGTFLTKDDFEGAHVNYQALTRPTGFHDFVCNDPDPNGNGDGDIEFRLHIFVNTFAGDFPSLPTDFMDPNGKSIGWGNENVLNEPFETGDDSQDLLLKFLNIGLRDQAAADALGLQLGGKMAYIGLEGLMYGGDGGKTGYQVLGIPYQQTTECDTATINRLFPGWADTGGNSILINGRPINGVLPPSPDAVTIDGGDDTGKRVFFHTLLGHGLHPFDTNDVCPPTQVRVTGALVLDCGHSDPNHDTITEYPAPTLVFNNCFQNLGYDPDLAGDSQNQEMHPFYSLDIIEPPLGFNNPTDVAPSDLSGAWGSSDGGTYYFKHIGNTIWWLGLTRNRSPLIPASAMTCSCQKIPDPANVFEGTITVNPDGSATITGNSVIVPKGLNPGGTSTTAIFNVEPNHKVMHLISTTSPFPFPSRFDKLWEP